MPVESDHNPHSHNIITILISTLSHIYDSVCHKLAFFYLIKLKIYNFFCHLHFVNFQYLISISTHHNYDFLKYDCLRSICKSQFWLSHNYSCQNFYFLNYDRLNFFLSTSIFYLIILISISTSIFLISKLWLFKPHNLDFCPFHYLLIMTVYSPFIFINVSFFIHNFDFSISTLS